MKTYTAKKSEIEKKWYVIDASDKVLGRLATQIASILRGKNKPTFSPHQDVGDYVIVINAKNVVLTGKKLDQKKAYRHSGYPGGLKTKSYRDLIDNKPEEIIIKAVKGMLPHNTLGRSQLSKLKVYADSDHPHNSQNPQILD